MDSEEMWSFVYLVEYTTQTPMELLDAACYALNEQDALEHVYEANDLEAERRWFERRVKGEPETDEEEAPLPAPPAQ